jgi:hypothetical protein
MAYQDIFLVVQFQRIRVPFLHVSRNPETLDHVVMDRGRDHRGKLTYHGDGHAHLQDVDAAPDWRDELRRPGYRGGCSMVIPVADLTSPQYVAGFQIDALRLLNEDLYTKRETKEYALLEVPDSTARLEVQVLLCPKAAVGQLEDLYEVVSLYKGCEPLIAFCLHERQGSGGSSIVGEGRK